MNVSSTTWRLCREMRPNFWHLAGLFLLSLMGALVGQNQPGTVLGLEGWSRDDAGCVDGDNADA
jgi:hypothetical protein